MPYESVHAAGRDLDRLREGVDPALFHREDGGRLLRVHEQHAALAVGGHYPDLPPVGPFMMRRLADARTMHVASHDLVRSGGQAPGPNGVRLTDLDNKARWSLCRALAIAIRAGDYRPGPTRRVRIPKEGKPGQHRELTIENVEDRVVGRALVRILQPVCDRTFSPLSFGFRPRRGTLPALATALHLARGEGRWVWVSADVARAFDAIPLSRFLDVCRCRYPVDMVDFIRLIADTGNPRGLRQGNPASPLFANLFFDHFLDQPWHGQRPDSPLLRYVDDLLVPCRTVAEAQDVYVALTRRLTSIGTPLKGTTADSIFDLAAGGSIDWLGFTISLQNGEPSIRIARQAWRRLMFRLHKAHLCPDSSIRAAQIVTGWIGHMGPCYAFEDADRVVSRVRRIAAALAFDEIPSDRNLVEHWSAAHARWCRLRNAEMQSLNCRLQSLRQLATAAADRR